MKANTGEALAGFRAYSVPHDGPGDNPFKLACSFSAPAGEAEITTAFPAQQIPAELLSLWSASRESRLFEDVEYGQWGLVLLSPSASAERTAGELRARPRDFRADDIIVGEFLGDLELLVVAPSEESGRRILVALPLDKREDWDPVASSMTQFLERFLEARGEKYWEGY